MKVVNLSVHKNNRKQRLKKEFRKEAVKKVKELVTRQDIDGVCILAWHEDKSSSMAYLFADPGKDGYNIKDIPSLFSRNFRYLDRS